MYHFVPLCSSRRKQGKIAHLFMLGTFPFLEAFGLGFTVKSTYAAHSKAAAFINLNS